MCQEKLLAGATQRVETDDNNNGLMSLKPVATQLVEPLVLFDCLLTTPCGND